MRFPTFYPALSPRFAKSRSLRFGAGGLNRIQAEAFKLRNAQERFQRNQHQSQLMIRLSERELRSLETRHESLTREIEALEEVLVDGAEMVLQIAGKEVDLSHAWAAAHGHGWTKPLLEAFIANTLEKTLGGPLAHMLGKKLARLVSENPEEIRRLIQSRHGATSQLQAAPVEGERELSEATASKYRLIAEIVGDMNESHKREVQRSLSESTSLGLVKMMENLFQGHGSPEKELIPVRLIKNNAAFAPKAIIETLAESWEKPLYDCANPQELQRLRRDLQNPQSIGSNLWVLENVDVLEQPIHRSQQIQLLNDLAQHGQRRRHSQFAQPGLFVFASRESKLPGLQLERTLGTVTTIEF